MLRQVEDARTYFLGLMLATTGSLRERNIRDGVANDGATPLYTLPELAANASAAPAVNHDAAAGRVRGEMWFWYCPHCGKRQAMPERVPRQITCATEGCGRICARRNVKPNLGDMCFKFHWFRFGVVELHGSDACRPNVSSLRVQCSVEARRARI